MECCVAVQLTNSLQFLLSLVCLASMFGQGMFVSIIQTDQVGLVEGGGGGGGKEGGLKDLLFLEEVRS